MKKIILLLAVCFAGCSTSEERLAKQQEKIKRENTIYKIYCEMPGSREVKSFAVDFNNMSSPSNFRGGIWSFRTLDGKRVRSSLCHTEE